jgi:hypothetical protein
VPVSLCHAFDCDRSFNFQGRDHQAIQGNIHLTEDCQQDAITAELMILCFSNHLTVRLTICCSSEIDMNDLIGTVEVTSPCHCAWASMISAVVWYLKCTSIQQQLRRKSSVIAIFHHQQSLGSPACQAVSFSSKILFLQHFSDIVHVQMTVTGSKVQEVHTYYSARDPPSFSTSAPFASPVENFEPNPTSSPSSVLHPPHRATHLNPTTGSPGSRVGRCPYALVHNCINQRPTSHSTKTFGSRQSGYLRIEMTCDFNFELACIGRRILKMFRQVISSFSACAGYS